GGGAPRLPLRAERGSGERRRLRAPGRGEGAAPLGEHGSAGVFRRRPQASFGDAGYGGEPAAPDRRGRQAGGGEVRPGPSGRAHPGARGDPRGGGRDLRRATPGRLVLLDRVPAQPHGRTAPGGDRLLSPGGGNRR